MKFEFQTVGSLAKYGWDENDEQPCWFGLWDIGRAQARTGLVDRHRFTLLTARHVEGSSMS